MTKEQAREYATRTRLGEPVYWETGGIGAVLADGTQIARSEVAGWEACLVLGVRRTFFPVGRTSFTMRWVLEALDQRANAP